MIINISALLNNKILKVFKLQWNQTESKYISNEFLDTSNKLGNLTFIYDIKFYILELLSDISFTIIGNFDNFIFFKNLRPKTNWL